jgi:hypothetical protein
MVLALFAPIEVLFARERSRDNERVLRVSLPSYRYIVICYCLLVFSRLLWQPLP